MYFLGVDGGGTKTACMIINEHGNILAYLNRETIHYKQIGINSFKDRLTEAVKELCCQIGIKPDEITYSFLGLPGYGEYKAEIPLLDSIVRGIMKNNNYRCGNDVEAGWAGSLACQPGINIVAGTGAIGFGKDYNGRSKRSSGWGELCGDEGSGYWLGKKVLELFTKEADGRLEKTPLYHIVREELSLESDFAILSRVTNDYRKKRNKIAGLSRLLYKAALKNDPYAVNIFQEAACEFDLIIASLIKKLGFNNQEEIMVSYSGGVFKAGSLILEPLETLIKKREENIRLVKPVLEPVTGAALYALKLTQIKFDQDIIQRLQEQERIEVLLQSRRRSRF